MAKGGKSLTASALCLGKGGGSWARAAWAPAGSGAPDFQQQVWAKLIKIPYGKTASYSDIAERIGNPTAVRAVGLANRNNPIAIVVPCHRVIGKAGELRGYFYGLDT